MASSLKQNIGAYDEIRADLELDHFGEWAVLHDLALAGTYDTFEDAAEDAVRRFGRGPYLIRQIGTKTPSLPPSFTVRRFVG